MTKEVSNQEQISQDQEQIQIQEQTLLSSFIEEYDNKTKKVSIQSKWFKRLTEDTLNKQLDIVNKMISFLPKELVEFHIEKQIPILAVYLKNNHNKKGDDIDIYIRSPYIYFCFDNKIFDEKLKCLLSLVKNDLENTQNNNIDKETEAE